MAISDFVALGMLTALIARPELFARAPGERRDDGVSFGLEQALDLVEMLAAMVEASEADGISRRVDRGCKGRRNMLDLVIDLLGSMEGKLCQDTWHQR